MGAARMKPARLDADDLGDPAACELRERLRHRVRGLAERARVAEQRGDVLEHDAGLREVGDVADEALRRPGRPGNTMRAVGRRHISTLGSRHYPRRRVGVCGQELDLRKRAAMEQPDDRVRRARRVRRRRVRRGLGTLAFLAVAAAICRHRVLGGVKESGDDSRSVASQSTSRDHHTADSPAGPFKVTDGVNVRTGPGTSFPESRPSTWARK